MQTWQPVIQNRHPRNCTNSPLRATRIHSLTARCYCHEPAIYVKRIRAPEGTPAESTGWRRLSLSNREETSNENISNGAAQVGERGARRQQSGVTVFTQ